MDLAKLLNDFVAQHHLVPIAFLGLMLRVLLRPALVDIRSACVWLVAFFLAVGSQWGITAEKVAEFAPQAEKIMPEVPAAESAGIIGKLLGVPDNAGKPPH